MLTSAARNSPCHSRGRGRLDGRGRDCNAEVNAGVPANDRTPAQSNCVAGRARRTVLGVCAPFGAHPAAIIV